MKFIRRYKKLLKNFIFSKYFRIIRKIFAISFQNFFLKFDKFAQDRLNFKISKQIRFFSLKHQYYDWIAPSLARYSSYSASKRFVIIMAVILLMI